MKFAPCFAAVLAFAPILPAQADPLDDRLEKARQTLSAAAAKLAAETPTEPERVQRQTATAKMLRRYAESLQAEAGGNLAGALRQLSAMEGMPAEAAAEIKALLSDLPKLTAERDESAIAAIEALVKKVAPACLAAKDEAELDPLLREVSRPLRGQFSRSEDPLLARSYRKLQAAQRTVSQWQDYLAQRAAGNAKAADNVLQSIGSQSDYPIISQEEITRCLSAKEPTRPWDKEAVRILSEVKTLDALPAALGEVRALGGLEAQKEMDLVFLNRIAAAYAAYQAGFIGAAFYMATERFQDAATSADPLRWRPEIARLHGLLFLTVLPRYLELPAASPPAPAEDGTAYLLRLADETAAAGRWAETARIIATYRLVAFRHPAQPPAWIEEDVTGLKAFAAAEQFAAAKAFAEAMKSYQRAAATNGKYTPAARAAARLGEITAAHPAEAETAAMAAQTEQQLREIQQRFIDEAVRALEMRLPQDVRNRMVPPRPNP